MIPEESYIVQSFTELISAKAIIQAKDILKKNGFENVQLIFNVEVREKRYFTVSITCDEYIYNIPEIDLYDDIIKGGIDEGTEDFIKSYGMFLAHDFASRHGKEIDIVLENKKNESSNDTRKKRGRPAKRNIESN